MRTATLIFGVFCIFVVLLDAFQTIILPRRATGPVRLTRIFYMLTWKPWRSVASRISSARRREAAFSFYGPLSLILLLVVWAVLMLLGFGMIYHAIGSPFNDPAHPPALWTDIYVSGTTLFTLGLGDVTPHTQVGRLLLVTEAGTGFGFLALIMGYFPVLYGAFSRREVSISLLDARAGSPPTAAELLRRHAHPGAAEALSTLLTEWERWSAELLESHISYGLLCYYRSQHTNQSWIGSLTAILDTAALLISGVQGHEARQAQLTFAMARHAMVDLSQIFSLQPATDAPDRLPAARYNELYGVLCQSGVSMCRDDRSEERLRELRRLYEPYAEALSAHFSMPLPPWIAAQPHKDNWLAVSKVRANAEQANAPLNVPLPGQPQPSPTGAFHDERHEF